MQPDGEKPPKVDNGEGTSSDRSRSSRDPGVHSSDTVDPIHEQHGGNRGGNGPEYESEEPKEATFSKSTVRETTPDYEMHPQKSEGHGDIEEVHEGVGFARRRFGRHWKYVRMVIHAAIFILFTG